MNKYTRRHKQHRAEKLCARCNNKSGENYLCDNCSKDQKVAAKRYRIRQSVLKQLGR